MSLPFQIHELATKDVHIFLEIITVQADAFDDPPSVSSSLFYPVSGVGPDARCELEFFFVCCSSILFGALMYREDLELGLF